MAFCKDVLQKLVLSFQGMYVRKLILLWSVVSMGFAEPGSGSSMIFPSVLVMSVQSELFAGGSVTLKKAPVTFPHMVTWSVCFGSVMLNVASTKRGTHWRGTGTLFLYDSGKQLSKGMKAAVATWTRMLNKSTDRSLNINDSTPSKRLVYPQPAPFSPGVMEERRLRLPFDIGAERWTSSEAMASGGRSRRGVSIVYRLPSGHSRRREPLSERNSTAEAARHSEAETDGIAGGGARRLRRERRSPMRWETESRKIFGLFKRSKRSTQKQQQQWTRRRASWTVCLTDRGGGVDGGGGGFSQLLADNRPEAGDARGSIGRWVGLPRTSCSSRS